MPNQGDTLLTKRILLVDDSATALFRTTVALRATPHKLITARNGREAVNKALEDRPDLVILDVEMPEMDGFEVCRRLRTLALTRDVPIVMLTSRCEEGHEAQGFESGCDAYLTKPVDSGKLLATVRNLLAR